MTDPVPDLGLVIKDAIDNDKLTIMMVTSRTSVGGVKTERTSFGAGKTTLAMQIAYRWNHYDPEDSGMRKMSVAEIGETIDREHPRSDPSEWGKVLDVLWATPDRIVSALRKANQKRDRLETDALKPYRDANPDDEMLKGMLPDELDRLRKTARWNSIINVGIWDDVQYSMIRKQGMKTWAAKAIARLTKGRPGIAVLVLTGDNINGIPGPLVQRIEYELIVNARGQFIVEYHDMQKRYRDGSRDRDVLKAGKSYTFSPLPPAVQLRYDAWRRKTDEETDPELEKEIIKGLRLVRHEAPQTVLPEAPPRPLLTPGMGRTEKGI